MELSKALEKNLAYAHDLCFVLLGGAWAEIEEFTVIHIALFSSMRRLLYAVKIQDV